MDEIKELVMFRIILVACLSLFILGCSSTPNSNVIYLSSESSIDKLMAVRMLNKTIEDLSRDVSQSADSRYADELKTAFKHDLLLADFKEYLLMNIPEANAQAWIEYYSSDFQMKISQLESDVTNATNEAGYAEAVAKIKRNEQKMAKLNHLLNLMDTQKKVRSIFHNGIFKPLIYGTAISNSPGTVINQEKLDRAIDDQITAILPQTMVTINDLSYFAYGQLSESDLNQLIAYYETPISEYYDNTLVAAISHALSKASGRFVNAVSEKNKSQIQSARFNQESCLKVQSTHVCEVLEVNSVGLRESLYAGSSVIGKSATYRIMSPSDEWQKVVVNNQYKDDLIVSRKDGEAIFSITYLPEKKLAAKEYSQEMLGELATVINEQPTLINLAYHSSLKNPELYELCFNYYGVDICKIAGEAMIGAVVIQVDAMFAHGNSYAQDIINLLTSIEQIESLSQN